MRVSFSPNKRGYHIAKLTHEQQGIEKLKLDYKEAKDIVDKDAYDLGFIQYCTSVL